MSVKDFDWIESVKCCECGKEIYIADKEQWAYKDTTRNARKNYVIRYYCSWKCKRAKETKESEDGRSANRRERVRHSVRDSA